MSLATLDVNNLSDTWMTHIERTNSMIGFWNDLGTYDDVNITGGALENVAISANSFTSASITGTNTVDFQNVSTFILAENIISGNAIDGGVISDVMVLIASTPTDDAHATSKQYVDGLITSLNTSVTNLSNSLATVATSGSYTDLSGTPSLGTLAALSVVSLTSNVSGILPIANGGTNASTAADAATNLGLGTTSTVQHASLGIGLSAPASGAIKVSKTVSFNSEIDNGSKTTDFTIDWTSGQKQKVTLAGSGLTMTFGTPTGIGHYQLKIIQGTGGSFTKGTWPTIKTPYGGASSWSLSTAAGSEDILNLYYDGTSWYGQLSLGWS